eukprot:6033968-Prymnesium_polylepis.1
MGVGAPLPHQVRGQRRAQRSRGAATQRTAAPARARRDGRQRHGGTSPVNGADSAPVAAVAGSCGGGRVTARVEADRAEAQQEERTHDGGEEEEGGDAPQHLLGHRHRRRRDECHALRRREPAA